MGREPGEPGGVASSERLALEVASGRGAWAEEASSQLEMSGGVRCPPRGSLSPVESFETRPKLKFGSGVPGVEPSPSPNSGLSVIGVDPGSTSNPLITAIGLSACCCWWSW